MSKASGGELNERERACLEHVRQAQALKLSFSEYCRQKGLQANQWYWLRRGLIRKGVLAGRGKAKSNQSGGFIPVRLAPPAPAGTACRIQHPSGWVIECGSLPQVQWLSALLSGEAA